MITAEILTRSLANFHCQLSKTQVTLMSVLLSVGFEGKVVLTSSYWWHLSAWQSLEGSW